MWRNAEARCCKSIATGRTCYAAGSAQQVRGGAKAARHAGDKAVCRAPDTLLAVEAPAVQGTCDVGVDLDTQAAEIVAGYGCTAVGTKADISEYSPAF